MNDFAIPDELIGTLRTAGHVVTMTGAGVSAESGVPTFRDAQTGLWAKYDPTELATPQAFERDPELVWNWYQWRREKVAAVKPNAGHYALVELGSLVNRFSLVTQNVDGLHQQAGSGNVTELHGSIVRAKCYEQNHVAEEWPDDSCHKPPHCKLCNSLMRPDVVWFNESLPANALESAAEASANCDVFLSIGTSSVVHPAASLAISAIQSGATVVEINPQETPLTPHVSYRMAGPSGEILPRLVEALKSTSDDPVQ